MDPRAEISVLIVDDEADMRALLRMLIEDADDGLRVSAEAADGPGAIASWAEHHPQVIVLDNRMPGMDGLHVAAEILARQPSQRIVLFSAHLDEATTSEAARLGVNRCLSKTDVEQVPTAIRMLAATG